jgi:hypothetical protein
MVPQSRIIVVRGGASTTYSVTQNEYLLDETWTAPLSAITGHDRIYEVLPPWRARARDKRPVPRNRHERRSARHKESIR